MAAVYNVKDRSFTVGTYFVVDRNVTVKKLHNITVKTRNLNVQHRGILCIFTVENNQIKLIDRKVWMFLTV